jgi:hypothetical protein
MGTSNWQNISFDLEVIRNIYPRTILDVGIGFGRWGILCREILDVRDGHISPKDWQVEIVGIEACEKYIQPYHSVFYSRVIHGEAMEYVSSMNERFDLIILGDVLEHFQKDQGAAFLDLCLSKAEYVLLNIPIGAHWPQSPLNDNVYEEHKSSWTRNDFIKKPVIIEKLFSDHVYRPYGVFVLSITHRKLPDKSMYDQTKSMIFLRYPSIKRFLKRIFLKR